MVVAITIWLHVPHKILHISPKRAPTTGAVHCAGSAPQVVASATPLQRRVVSGHLPHNLGHTSAYSSRSGHFSGRMNEQRESGSAAHLATRPSLPPSKPPL